MGYQVEREVNEHFAPFYPYVADEVLAEYGRKTGRVLEIGPYGPGVSVALAKKCPQMTFVCGDEYPEALAYFRECVRREGLIGRVEIQSLDKSSLVFDAEIFDLVIFREGLFFWEDQEKILSEMNRVLRPGGTGVHGGGFGAGAPDELIESLLPRARELNDQMGKKRLSKGDAEKIVLEAGLEGKARISLQHGMWILWQKG